MFQGIAILPGVFCLLVVTFDEERHSETTPIKEPRDGRGVGYVTWFLGLGVE